MRDRIEAIPGTLTGDESTVSFHTGAAAPSGWSKTGGSLFEGDDLPPGPYGEFRA